MAWWSREKAVSTDTKKSVPKGMWRKCEVCQEAIFGADLAQNLNICSLCDFHFPLGTNQRIALMLDEGSFVEHDTGVVSGDPLEFQVDSIKYRDQIKNTTKKSGQTEAFRAGSATLGGHAVEVGFFAFEFMGGSMGSAVGERIARQFERAAHKRCPAIVFSASGGARMHEGILSLMQMAKTSAALARVKAAGAPYISVLLHPTTGGVAASFAMLGDVIFAEPRALIGFAGPRVIEQTIRQKLPEGFQTSESLLDHGIIDGIVDRRALRDRLIRTIRWFGVARPANGVG